MRRLWVSLLFMGIFFMAMGADQKEQSFEESFVYLRVNKKYGDTFFPVLLKGDGREVYVGIEELLNLLEVQTLNLDNETGKLEGELLFTDDRAKEIWTEKYENNPQNIKKIIAEKKLYVEVESLSKILPIRYASWERERALLDLGLGFLMPIEVREIQERKLQSLTTKNDVDEDKKIIRSEKSIFSPGVAQVRYFNSDFSDREGTDTLEVNYYNQLLYGDFKLQTTLKPDQDVSYTALKYNEVLGENSVVLGDIALQKDSPMSLKGNDFRGISVLRDDIYIDRDRDALTIEGQVLNGTTVELYQWGNLIDLQNVRTDNKFIFEDVPVIGFSDTYTLKFYYPDGSFEEKEIAVLGDNELQNKGESDYYFQLGELEDELTVSSRYLYGVTDNLTLGAGYLRGKSISADPNDFLDDEEFEDEEFEGEDFIYSSIGTDILYRTKAKKNPTLYSLKLFTDIEENEEELFPENNQTSRFSYKGRIRKTMWKQDIELFYDEYSKSVADNVGSERLYGLVIGSGQYKLYYSISFQREEEFPGESDRYRLNLRYPFTDNLRGTWDNNYYDYSYDRENRFTSRFGLSYSGFQNIDLSTNILTEISDGENEETYEVRVSKKGRNLSKGDLDYYAYVRYNSEEWKYGIGFEYFFTNWLSTPSIITDDEQEFGISVDKTIILSDPFKKNINPEPENAWIEGKIFIDENGDGIYNEGEEVLEGVQVVSRRDEIGSDENGYFFLSDVPSDTKYEFKVDSTSIDPFVRPLNESYMFNLSPATGYKLDIPMVTISAIMGNIKFINEDKMDEREMRIAYQQTKVYLKKNGTIIMEDNAEIDGFYLLENVLPGEYTLEIKYLGSKGYKEVDKSYEIHIKSSATGEFFDGYDFEMTSNTADGDEKKKTSQDLDNKEKSGIKVEEISENQVRSYFIKPGDTLSEIAQRKGLSMASILDENKWILSPHLIHPHKELMIPKYVVSEKSFH